MAANEDDVAERLRVAGARFAYVFGSRAATEGPWGAPGPHSDLDVAAWWGADPPAPWDLDLGDDVDLVVLDDAALHLAGRVALHGRLLFDDDPPARVRWQAQTTKIYLDEAPRRRQFDLDHRQAVLRGRR